MCGIVGLINTTGEEVNPKYIEEMNSSIEHRGPTEGSIFISGSLGLGNRRLAIIDLNGGKQPLANENNQILITYNGEIYNYKELQKELISKGHTFKTNSDTEVVVHAYESWGKHCVEHFRGMFAFAIADLKKRELFLAKDHLGIKPLFYILTPTFFAFASELQAFRCLPNLQLSVDIEALDQYLFLQYIPAPKTVFQQVSKLKPAHRLTVSFDGVLSEPEEYWQLEFKPNYAKNEVDWIEETESVIKESVESHLISDVPFGAFLSGGLDSSCIVAYMSQILEKPIKTFTIGFEDDTFNELKYAEMTSKRWNTEHYIEILKPNAIEILPLLVRHYGEPFGDSSSIPTYYVSKLAQRHVPMVLSGDGGDELFAGYGTYKSWVSSNTGHNRPLWRKIGRKFAEIINPNRYPPKGTNLNTWFHIIKYLSFDSRRKLWRPEFRKKCNKSIAEYENLYAKTDKFELCSKVQFLDLKTYLPYDILSKVDIASMMHGLETRTPLVDIRVAEFAVTVPQAMNISKDINNNLQGKMLLKKVMRKYYPEKFLDRPKMGFSIPAQKWLDLNGTNKKNIREQLLDKGSKVLSYFEPSEISKLIDQNQTRPVWLFLFLNEWLNQLD